jgi:hypothetical protein
MIWSCLVGDLGRYAKRSVRNSLKGLTGAGGAAWPLARALSHTPKIAAWVIQVGPRFRVAATLVAAAARTSQIPNALGRSL